ncbi:uncharacterized protein YegL [Paenibacillus sp. V4I9]|jgi:uncharacterized protein YegL|uniref:vWA domain-containing protein n=1 Tax=Paenibacillus sp. V4I9 TaxID=3042308 RepID=UPI002787302C|nr:VWA domain-containing protein [Paenibacillus sp. V4I9]MDQ0885028.1 uncharacterized protein YegL [Paenibacillus sp. V4I9]
MGKYDKVEGISKRTMNLFFIIDKSFSMAGSKIGTVNVAVREVIPEIQQIAEDSADANIKIAVLTFSTGAEWMYQAAIDAKDFKWSDINVDGMTDMGHAFKLLNEKLSRNGGFMTDAAGSYAPALFLLSDGQPTDDYQKVLNELKNNNWFKASLKAALAIGDDADKDMLAEFTGNRESVLTVHTSEALKKLIRFVSVTASKIGSKSSNAPVDGQDKTKQDDFNKQIVNFNDQLVDSQYDDWN